MTVHAGIDWLVDTIRELEDQTKELNRKLNNVVREGRVVEVFNDGTAIVDAQDVRTKPLPWITRAGKVRDWDPPTAGERVLLISPTGDPGRAIIVNGGFSEEFSQNHDNVSEARRTIGETEITSAEDGHTIKSRVITFQADEIRLVGNVLIEGETLTHNGKDVGDTHRHSDVVPGPAPTGKPI